VVTLVTARHLRHPLETELRIEDPAQRVTSPSMVVMPIYKTFSAGSAGISALTLAVITESPAHLQEQYRNGSVGRCHRSVLVRFGDNPRTKF
jgi:hypothetical protein